MKKICFVTTIYVTYKCFLKQFSEYLHRSGEYDISLICNNEEKMAEDLPEFVHYFPVKMSRGVSLSAFNALNEINKIFREEKFDIVQYSTPNAALYASIAAKSNKIPVRLYCQWGIRYMGFEGIKRGIFKFLEKITCDNSTFIEAESNSIRNFALEEKLYSENKSCVIWNGSASGVDLQKFNLENKQGWKRTIRRQYTLNDMDVVFSFAGRLTADKGINELLYAFLNIEKKYPNVKLFIMGGMDDYDSIDTKLFTEAKSSQNIIFTGNVSNVEEYYAASDIFVAPSYREGFGLVVVEAEAMALPAIVSDVPGQTDAVKKDITGLICKVKSGDSLQKAMEKLVEDPKLRANMGNAAANYARNNYEQNKLFELLKKHRDALVD